MPDKHKKPGPEADRLTIEADDWQEAVKKAISIEKPPEGWPKSSDKPDNRGEDE